MLEEALQALAIRPDGVYLDGSFGYGGHARSILSRLGSRGRVYAIDQDWHALTRADVKDKRLILEHCRWSNLDRFIDSHALTNRLDGVLFDIGVSSPQLDDAQRGFSFMNDGPLDMRMDSRNGTPASVWVNSAKREELISVLRHCGEEPHAAKVATAIVRARAVEPIQGTVRLAEIIAAVKPKPWHKHPATRAFQAIRIHVNRELEELESALNCVPDMLRTCGRLVVISFHSLEDRLVKHFIRNKATVSAGDAAGLPLRQSELPAPCLRILGRMRRPSDAEVERNPRARSARMRIAERLDVSVH